MADGSGLGARLALLSLVAAGCAGLAAPSVSAPAGPTENPVGGATPATTATVEPSPSATATVLPARGTWARLEVAGDHPPSRDAHTWTVDAATGMAYLFGGRDGATVFGDLWRFDPRTEAWTRLEPSGPAPQARFGHDAVWLSGRGLVVFAGQSGTGFFGDLWLYDPDADTWSALPAGGDPPIPRYGSCAVLGRDDRLWISHGFTEDRIRFADTRAYDFEQGAWLDRSPTGGDVPVARCLHACFEADDGRFVLFGGQTTGVAALGDLWALDPSEGAGRWAELTGALPRARNLYAFSRLRGAWIVFGGGSLDGGYLRDTWAFSASDLSAAPMDTSGGPPPARSGASLVEDPAAGRLLLFGGRDDDGAFDDLWALGIS